MVSLFCLTAFEGVPSLIQRNVFPIVMHAQKFVRLMLFSVPPSN